MWLYELALFACIWVPYVLFKVGLDCAVLTLHLVDFVDPRCCAFYRADCYGRGLFSIICWIVSFPCHTCGPNSSLQYLTLSYFKPPSLLLCVSTGTHSQTVVLVLILLAADSVSQPFNAWQAPTTAQSRMTSPFATNGHWNHQHVPSSTAVTTLRVPPAPNTKSVHGVVLSTSAWFIQRLHSFNVRERSCTEKLAHIPSLKLLLLMGISLFKAILN